MAEEKQMTKDEKLQAYEELLSELTDPKVKREGKILAGPYDGYYRVLVGGEEILAKSSLFRLKKTDQVIIVDGQIVERLPAGLQQVEEETVDFQRIKWNEIGGMKSQIEAIQKKVEYPILHQQLFKEFKLEPSKGILLYGPPGCGKTLIARAIASTLLSSSATKDSFVYIKGGELLSKYVGETEQKIKRIFDSARKLYKKTGTRPILFIDEAEAILPARGSRVSSDVDTTIVPSFLSEMDGLEGNNPFVILATNYKERIDEAIQRPGRIDMKIYIGRPNQEDSIEIFKIHLRKTKVLGDITELAKEAAGHLFSIEMIAEEVSGALIENVVKLATENAIMRKIANSKIASGITMEDIIFAINHQN